MNDTFKLIHKKNRSRAGLLHTPHGKIETPVFMPVGTQATVKSVSSENLRQTGAPIILSNAYHLYLRPGTDVIKQAGGLHKFMNWDRAILTDSGGYQVFSLAKLMKVRPDGVEFQSHIDGKRHFLTPEDVVDIQLDLGSDIIMVLDECVSYPATKEKANKAVHLSLNWAKRSKKHFEERLDALRLHENRPLLFGIVQGSMYSDLRQKCAEELVKIGFDGYAIGGVSVGEPEEELYRVVEETAPYLPEDKPRYLMGVGRPQDIRKAVAAGVDMFDCVIPTRNGRNGTAFTSKGKLNLRNSQYIYDQGPIDAACDCYACKDYSLSYIRHLLNAREILGSHLVSYHNLYYFQTLMAQIRASISTA